MADNGDPDSFSVDIEALERGGVNIRHLAEIAGSIYGTLFSVTDKYGKDLGGNGDVGKSFATNYWPGAEASLQFLRDLKDLVDTHGEKTIDLGHYFDDVDETTTNEANGSHHRR
jgi:hypothetical protein